MDKNRNSIVFLRFFSLSLTRGGKTRGGFIVGVVRAWRVDKEG